MSPRKDGNSKPAPKPQSKRNIKPTSKQSGKKTHQRRWPR